MRLNFLHDGILGYFITIQSTVTTCVLQYTDWEHANDGYLNQKMIGDVVGDYFFICPTNHFAQAFADHGLKVYYYFFTQVRLEYPTTSTFSILQLTLYSKGDHR